MSYLQFILFLMLLGLSQSSCHYSCGQCSNKYYTQCITCSNHHLNISPITTSAAKSVGLCVDDQNQKVNGLGILLLIVGIVSAFLFRSSFIMYFILTFQTLGLLSLVQSSLTEGLFTILGAFQYFMIFSLMQKNSKQAGGQYLNRYMYRLNHFLQSIDFSLNFNPIIAINILGFSLLLLVSLFKAFRGLKCKAIKQHHIETFLVAVRTFLLMIMQESFLIIYAGIRFSTLTSGLQFLIILYGGMTVFLMVSCNMNLLPYFGNKELMNLTFLKRLLLPVLVILPYKFTYTLLFFMIAFTIIQLILLTKSKTKPKRYIYTGLQLLCLILFGGYLIAQLAANNQKQSQVISIISIISLVLFIFLFIAEIAILLKNKFTANTVKNLDNWQIRVQGSEKISALRQNDTMDDMNNNVQVNQGQQNVPQIQRQASNQAQNNGLEAQRPQKKVINVFDSAKREQTKFRVSKVK